MNETKTSDLEAKDILDRSSRLRVAVTRSGGVTAVSRISGIAATTIQNYTAGRDLKVGALVALARACNVSLEWLATGYGTMDSRNEVTANCFTSFGSSLGEPVNFFGFCILLGSCQEWHAKMNATPTLGEVFEWIGPIYPKTLKFLDKPIRLMPEEEIN